MENIFKIFEQLNKQNKPSVPIEYLVVGLGNPGSQYENTRHNAGFMTIDYIAKHLNINVDKLKFKSLIAEASVADKRVLLMKPQTFMNLSGQAVMEALSFYKIPIENVIVIYDDISLEPGKIRIRLKGSAGGHNGIKNIIYLSNKDTFPRIKMGVGKKPNQNWDLADWVLSSFCQSDKEKLDSSFEKAFASLKLLLNGKPEEAMNKFNS